MIFLNIAIVFLEKNPFLCIAKKRAVLVKDGLFI